MANVRPNIACLLLVLRHVQESDQHRCRQRSEIASMSTHAAHTVTQMRRAVDENPWTPRTRRSQSRSSVPGGGRRCRLTHLRWRRLWHYWDLLWRLGTTTSALQPRRLGTKTWGFLGLQFITYLSQQRTDNGFGSVHCVLVSARAKEMRQSPNRVTKSSQPFEGPRRLHSWTHLLLPRDLAIIAWLSIALH